MLKNILLFPFSLIYFLIIYIRNTLYQKKIFRSIQFDLPVICIGNLTTGGTGKTPLTDYLIRFMKTDYPVSVLSRGYKRKTNGFLLVESNAKASLVGDEPLFYKLKHPEIQVAVCEDRVFGVSSMVQNQEKTGVYLLDDAFQHRAIKADLSIIITEYNNLYTRDKLLPMGQLREPISAAKRADIVVVSKCPPLLSKKDKQAVISELNLENYQKIYFSSVVYLPMYSLHTGQILDTTKYDTALVVAGIANPNLMYSQVQKTFKQTYLRTFPDHHNYEKKDLESILRTFQHIEQKNKIVIISEKDATKLIAFRDFFMEHQIEVYCLPISIKFNEDEKQGFDRAIKHFLSITLPQSQENTESIIYDYKVE